MHNRGGQTPIKGRNARLGPVVAELWPYIWPTARPDLRRRIFLALGLMILAKLATICVPFAYKWAIDALVAIKKGEAPASLLAGPIALTLLYGALRIVMAAFNQGRDAVFADVAMNAVRRLAVDVFVHLHALPMRFHLERKTGALTRVLERGRNAIETLARMVTLNGLPTALEFLLVLAVMLFHFDWRYATITVATIAAYLAFTGLATQWRVGIRRSMNESDSDANSKAIELASEL